jgi:hypothetical protein
MLLDRELTERVIGLAIEGRPVAICRLNGSVLLRGSS